jgi:DNA-directed RNA polymerase subunit E"
MVKQACKLCKRLTLKDACQNHQDAKLTPNWKGRIIILDPVQSDLAKKLGITEAGEYAMRV